MKNIYLYKHNEMKAMNINLMELYFVQKLNGMNTVRNPPNIIFSFEKRNAVKKHMRKIKLSDRSVTTDAKTILLEKFYKKLYTDTIQINDLDSVKAEVFFRNKNLSTLNDEEKELCEGPITPSECTIVHNSINVA